MLQENSRILLLKDFIFFLAKTLEIESAINETTNRTVLINQNWKTLVLISVNLAGFEIKMNVGNVMGNVK